MQYEQSESENDQIHESRGIFIPNEILWIENLCMSEKVLLAQISWYGDNGCFVKKINLASYLHMSIKQIDRLLKSLEKKGFIKKNGQLVPKWTTCPKMDNLGDNLSKNGNKNGTTCPFSYIRNTKRNNTKSIKNIYVEKAQKVLSEINRLGKEKGLFTRNLTSITHIIPRLKDKYSEDNLIQAWTNCSEKDWFIETGKISDLEYIFRKSKIDVHLNMVKKKKYNRDLYRESPDYKRKVDENRDRYY